jgi:hypothetical protein
VRHSESLELGRAQAVYLCWDRLSTILNDNVDLGDAIFAEVEEEVESLFDWCKRYADAHPDQRDEIVSGAKELGEKLGCN